MISLTDQLKRYIAIRQRLGYDMLFQARVLKKFTGFADAHGINHITASLFLEWKQNYGKASNSTWSARLGMVRKFAQWLNCIDPSSEVPPCGLVCSKYYRRKPYIYTNEEIKQIVVCAAQLPSVYGLRGLTSSTLFGLTAVTGMRIKEILALDDKDIDLDNALIYIKRGKNGRDRLIPISFSTVEKLKIYRAKRNLICKGNSSAFFLNDELQRPGDCGTRYNFAAVSQLIGLRKKERFHKHGTGPRFHDLRHTFAVRTIIDWYKKGLDVNVEMYKLSTYLGHIKPKYTYWYIEAVPELLRLASERAEKRLKQETQR